MTPSQETNQSDFLAALARFEHCLETPVVPGELPEWLGTALNACQRVGDLLRPEIEEGHVRLLAEIARQDMELAPRVQELKEQDQQLLAKWNDIHSQLVELRSKAEDVEPHEAKIDDRVECFTERALAFVIEARKQDAALTTWQLEAFNRDRGIAD